MNKNQFKQLQAKWYKKLKTDGFNDIERNEEELKVPSGTFRDNSRNGNEVHITREAKQEYYYLANQFLNNYPFKSPRDRIIWEYHSNGISMRNITKLLKKARVKTNKSTIGRKISTLRKIMRLNIW